MKLLAMTLLIGLLIDRCTESGSEVVSPDTVLIRTGTSFGMCVGYCQYEYVLQGTTVTLTQRTNGDPRQHPAKTCQFTLNAGVQNQLLTLINFRRFSQQPTTIGCPDCADGGAEYIELQVGEEKHRVTFDYGRTIPGFEPLVDLLRQQRTQFKSCN
ncbi:hypothetical protein [Spirosoma sp. KUDC1026]|uniref:hypothetical protein n=1 Tax=Spirosoma sp. KUDC1026 TaxID=2745947 RepID=UPI00159BDB18|nr:hypothetical protein [Spirosoma sp. KUDC1026]QKZ11698.1 hypothetical protein HU175_03280 [Spirosoma sp. KUDC1026]